ncbi:MAG: winged helix-turn-helix domain-containing protein, partial [Gemmataceae bacterium]
MVLLLVNRTLTITVHDQPSLRSSSKCVRNRRSGSLPRRTSFNKTSINEAAGEPLVVSATGGHRGGGAQLTSLGQLAVATFREVQQRLQQAALLLVRKQITSPDSPVVHVAAAVCLEVVLGQLLTDYSLLQPDVRVR